MADDLQNSIAKALAGRIYRDSFLRQFRETLEHDDAAGLKLEDAHEYAIKRGEASSGALLEVLRPGILPNDRMDMDTARQTVLPVLESNFDDVQDAANQVQRALDRAAGIGLNGVRADFPKGRAAGLLDRLTESESIEKMQSLLGEPVVNFSAASFDQWVHANADFRYKAGMSPQVVRKGHFGMCAWCAALVGTYDYEAVRYGSDVWRRHRNCRCTVTYVNGGLSQDAWSRKVWQASPEVLQARKITGTDIRRNAGKTLTQSPEKSTVQEKGLAEQIAEQPSMLGSYSPELLKDALERAGYDVKPLGRGSLKNIPFEQGGGFKVNFGGTGLIQYHPEKYSHHGGSYYKISTGERGLHRYEMDGTEQSDRPEKPKD